MSLVTYSGELFLAYAVFLAWLSTRVSLPNTLARRLIWGPILGNFGYATMSATVLVLGWLPLTPLGVAYVLLHIATVTVLGEFQWLGLRAWR